MRISSAILLVLLGWSYEAAAQAPDNCPTAPAWPAPAAKGHPDQEISACLRSEAYKARNLRIPVASVANGIAASCEVQVDRAEGALIYDDATLPERQRRALEQDVMRQANAAVTRYRSCATP
jgi:hypothetical protein